MAKYDSEYTRCYAAALREARLLCVLTGADPDLEGLNLSDLLKLTAQLQARTERMNG